MGAAAAAPGWFLSHLLNGHRLCQLFLYFDCQTQFVTLRPCLPEMKQQGHQLFYQRNFQVKIQAKMTLELSNELTKIAYIEPGKEVGSHVEKGKGHE